jgi:hypothetical protein
VAASCGAHFPSLWRSFCRACLCWRVAGFTSTGIRTSPALFSRPVRIDHHGSRTSGGPRPSVPVSKVLLRVYRFRAPRVYLLRRATQPLSETKRISETTVKRTLAVVPSRTDTSRTRGGSLRSEVAPAPQPRHPEAPSREKGPRKSRRTTLVPERAQGRRATPPPAVSSVLVICGPLEPSPEVHRNGGIRITPSAVLALVGHRSSTDLLASQIANQRTLSSFRVQSRAALVFSYKGPSFIRCVRHTETRPPSTGSSMPLI